MNTKFVDIRLVFPEKTFYSHRIKLYEDSIYFRNLFDAHEKTDVMDFGSINNITCSMMESYLHILYNQCDDNDYVMLLQVNDYLESNVIQNVLDRIVSVSNNVKIEIMNYICDNNKRYIKYFALIGKIIDTIEVGDAIYNFSYQSLRIVLLYKQTTDHKNILLKDYHKYINNMIINEKYKKINNTIILLYFAFINRMSLESDITTDSLIMKRIIEVIDLEYIIEELGYSYRITKLILNSINQYKMYHKPNAEIVKAGGTSNKNLDDDSDSSSSEELY